MTATAESPPDRPLSEWVEKYRWKFEAYHPALSAVMPAVQRFCSDVIAGDVRPYWLTILGPSGVGKTLALRQAFRMLSRNDHLWPRRTFNKDGSLKSEHACTHAHIVPGQDLDDWKAAKDYGDYDLLYVEDIGAGLGIDKGAGAVTSSRIAELMQYRPFKWTLLDANLSLQMVSTKLDPRIASRLLRDGSVLIELPKSVPDYNLR